MDHATTSNSALQPPRRSQRLQSSRSANRLQCEQQSKPQTKPHLREKTNLSSPSDAHLLDDALESQGIMLPGCVRNVKTSQQEKESVRIVTRIMLDSSRTRQQTPDPKLHDLTERQDRGWQPILLTSNAYDKLMYVVHKHCQLDTGIYHLAYDWIPHGDWGGTIVVRKRGIFQKVFTHLITEAVENEAANACDAIEAHEDHYPRFDHPVRASVLVKGHKGMRTPCAAADFRGPGHYYYKGPENHVRAFIIEVGMAEKSKELPDIAQSYISAGTLCVLTADIKLKEHGSLTVVYSTYRRGEWDFDTGRYEVIKQIKDLALPIGTLEFSLFDFFLATILKREYGVTDRSDPRAKISVPSKTLMDCLYGASAWNPPGPVALKDTEELESLLSDDA